MARRGGFPGMMGGNNNMQQLARQAQMLQQQISQLQENLDKREFEATAGGGMVRAKVNGEREVLELEIKPEAIDPNDVEMLQDMIVAALNEALKNAHETVGKRDEQAHRRHGRRIRRPAVIYERAG